MKSISDWQELFIIANAGEARLLSRTGGQWPLRPLETLYPEIEATRNRHGPNFHRGHMVKDQRYEGTSLSPRTDPLRKRHMAFAHQIAARIELAVKSGSCDGLIIVASCPFLGELRSALSPPLMKHLTATIEGDLTSFGLTELEDRLAPSLARRVDAGL